MGVFWKDRSGSSAVEFAILAPVFLLLVFGMIAYAIYFGAAHSVQQLAADAARVSIAGLSNDERAEIVSAYLEANAGTYLLLDRRKLTFSVGESESDSDQYQISVAYDASELPIWNLYPPIPLPASIITFASTIRKGGR